MFEWVETAQISNETVLQQTDYQFIAPEETGVIGARGKDVWTFKALKKGKSTLSMEYSQPEEGGEKGEWTFKSVITVK